jgi:hypothetical protein
VAVCRIEEVSEHLCDRFLLPLDMGTQLAADVAYERFADVFQLRFLRCGVRVVERPQTDGPRVELQLEIQVPASLRIERDVVAQNLSDIGRA